MKNNQKITRLFNQGWMHGYANVEIMDNQKDDYYIGYYMGQERQLTQKLEATRRCISDYQKGIKNL